MLAYCLLDCMVSGSAWQKHERVGVFIRPSMHKACIDAATAYADEPSEVRIVTLERNELQRCLAAAEAEAVDTNVYCGKLQQQLHQSETARLEVCILFTAHC